MKIQILILFLMLLVEMVLSGSSRGVVNNCKPHHFVSAEQAFCISQLSGSLFLSGYFTSTGRFIPTCRAPGCSFPGNVLTAICLSNAAVARSYPSFSACLHSPVFNRT
ncbi:MAG: hypothetical protein PHU68_10295 [Paludibacter sp.]|nr:hypothetical protein [Paludibacter sp.]